MVGIFSRFSAGGTHRRAKSSVEVVETLAPNMDTGESDPAAAAGDSPHGIEVGIEFKPVEHPVEPVNLDQPVKCPLPEPSILHDGRIWQERMSSTAGGRVRTDLPVVKEGSQLESDSSGTRPQPAVRRRAILPSVSAPEHNILALLDECDMPESQRPAE
uniref:Uncharacterized protein n=1 Tax=Avena sativa TaxID=4498 RepID=A0ACD5Z2M1_AVESA